MPEWLLSEKLAELLYDDHAASDPGVYALAIDVPDGGVETLARDWLDHYPATPPYLRTLVDAERVIYVGAAKNVRARIEDHLQGDVRKASLPRVWGVSDVVRVWWFEDADRAFEREHGLAMDLDHDTDVGTYVHSR